MKLNRSLGISRKIQACRTGDIIGLLEDVFPSSVLENPGNESSGRNRVFTLANTLLTMVLTAVQQDKTLKNSVDLYYMIHQQRKKEALKELEESLSLQKQLDSKKEKTAGRPKKYTIQLPASLEKDISLNTAAYSKARNRVPVALTESLFEATKIESATNPYTHWHGYRVFIGDGTYVQMQDSKSIRSEYEVKHNGIGSTGYPQGLVEAIIERGTGQLHGFRLVNRHVSELAVFYDMIDDLPEKSVLLLDDLYNCFEIISKCKRKGIEMVVPAKRARNYQLIEELGSGDDIIKISTPKSRSKWLDENEKANSFLLRRVECVSPEGKIYVLLTTILDKKISKEEIQLLYLTRWDIEIGIREIKTIMDINILRSKTPEMALKELTVSLATYNLIRKIIYTSIKDLPFSPEEDFIFEFYKAHQDILVDKKGRVYNKWSTGRRRTQTTHTQASLTKTKTKQKV